MGLALDEPKEHEEPVQINGIDVLISDEVNSIASVKKIDYINSLDGEGFIIAPKSGQSYC